MVLPGKVKIGNLGGAKWGYVCIQWVWTASWVQNMIEGDQILKTVVILTWVRLLQTLTFLNNILQAIYIALPKLTTDFGEEFEEVLRAISSVIYMLECDNALEHKYISMPFFGIPCKFIDKGQHLFSGMAQFNYLCPFIIKRYGKFECLHMCKYLFQFSKG